MSEREDAKPGPSRSAELFETTEQLVQIGSWEWLPEAEELRWSKNLYRILGLEPGEIEPTTEYVLENVHPDDAASTRGVEFALRKGEAVAPIDYRFIRPDGSIRYLRSTMLLATGGDGGPPRVIGTVQDLTDQRRAEREIAAHLAVDAALVEWDSLDTGGTALLRGLANALEFDVGVLWILDGEILAARLFWSGRPVDEFEAITRQLRLPPGAGFPGIAWNSQQPTVLRDLESSSGYIRHDSASRAGLNQALAIPLLVAGDTVALIELCARVDVEISERLTRTLVGIGNEIGTFFGTRRGELVAPSLTERELEVLQLAAGGGSRREIAESLGISPSTVKSHLANIYEKLGETSKSSAVANALRLGLID